MRDFWKNYCKLILESLRFLKKHWIGYIVYFFILPIVVTLAYYKFKEIMNNRKRKKLEENETDKKNGFIISDED